MKKTYISPTVLIVKVATGCQICTGSPNNTTPTNLTDVDNYSDDPGDFSRRRHRSVWDDDEEEQGW